MCVVLYSSAYVCVGGLVKEPRCVNVRFLNVSVVFALMISWGRLFQSRMVRGKYECLKSSVLVPSVKYFWVCVLRVLRGVGILVY